MYLLRPILPLLLALAIIGAPFGMGRMMDQVGAHQTMHASHDMQHGAMPVHKNSTPHYMICAACVAAGVQAFSAFDPIVLNATLDDAEPSVFHGADLLPLLQPPRNFILTV
jgi:hypothetical protein